ncbi:MAG: RAD52 family DNA repair protein [Synechococcaceae cyanobacterium]|nr:RAD52 family DNA repair protein [Synechococcaceae cyanobacterium]
MPAPPLASEPLTAGFTAEQVAALTAPLDRAKVKQREQGRGRVSYLEGWQVIAEANRIFGFDGWQRQTTSIHCVAQAERLIGREQKPGWGVTYIARVRVTVAVHGGTPLIREGSGAGHGIDVDLGQAHESALKEAETDAMKRALMTFGNPFGLALYDKQQREVTGAAEGGDRPKANPSARPAPLRAVPPAPARTPLRPLGVEGQAHARAAAAAPEAEERPIEPDPGLAPLDPGTIDHLVGTIRALPRPALEGFTKAFRKRFQVPDEAPSIADRICQRQHHDWIETFLVSHR